MVSSIFITFYFISSLLVAFPGLLFVYNSHLPQFVQDCLLYGKAKGKSRKWTAVQLIEIPKG